MNSEMTPFQKSYYVTIQLILLQSIDCKLLNWLQTASTMPFFVKYSTAYYIATEDDVVESTIIFVWTYKNIRSHLNENLR